MRGKMLFVNRSQDLLRENGFNFICSTVRHLVKELQEEIPRIRMLIKRGIVLNEDFAYRNSIMGARSFLRKYMN